jgi:uncharacterized membrane protein
MAKLAGGLVVVLVVCFPIYLWFVGWSYPGMTAVYLVTTGVLRFFTGASNKYSTSDWFMILVPIALGILVLLEGPAAGLYYPIVINLGLLLIFYSSLSESKNFIQRIAERKVDKPLDSVGIKYTRNVTLTWCAIFVMNILMSAILTWYERVDIWTLYNGVIAYIVIGSLFLGERLVRSRVQERMRRSQGAKLN